MKRIRLRPVAQNMATKSDSNPAYPLLAPVPALPPFPTGYRAFIRELPRALPQPLVLAGPAIALALLLILPFLNKAYAIDDPVFLLESLQTMRDFLHPLHFTICWDNPVVCAAAPLVVPNVTLIAYFLLPATWLGSPEWLVHLLQFGALCVGITATVSIALRLGCNRLEASFAGLLMAVFPLVLVYTNGATPDVLAMALGTAGMERLILWRRKPDIASGVSVAILLGLAPLGRPHLLLLTPIAAMLVASATGTKAARLLRAMGLFAVSAGIFWLGVLWSKDGAVNGAVIQPRLISTGTIFFNVLSYFWYLIVPFPLGIAWMLGARWRGGAVLLAAAGMLLALTLLGRVSSQEALIAVCAGCGTIALLAAAWNAARLRSGERMLLVAWSAIPLAAAAYVHLPPKYLIGGAPAIAILIVIFLRESHFPVRSVYVLAAACVTLSWLTLRADAEFAGKAREAAKDLILPQTTAGRRVWVNGEWGIYWYAQRAGAQVLMGGGPQPVSGDLLMVGVEGDPLN